MPERQTFGRLTRATFMKLNIGGGYKRIDGFHNVDHDPLTKPDFCFDLEKEPWPMEDNSVDEVRAHHILEHIGEGFFHVMKEMYRVCSAGAIIDIAVPHHRHEHFFGDPTHRRPITVPMLRQFSLKWCLWHREYFESSSGFAPRLGVDYEIIDYEYCVDPAYQKMAEEGKKAELEQLSMRFINVYKDVLIKLAVIK